MPATYRSLIPFLGGGALGALLTYSLLPGTSPAPPVSPPSAPPHFKNAARPPGAPASAAVGKQAPGSADFSLENVLAAAESGMANPALIDAMQQALKDPAKSRRTRRFITLLEAMRPEDALAVRDLFVQMDAKGEPMTQEWPAFWSRWGEVDGAGAMKYLTDLEDGGAGPDWTTSTIRMALESWAATDPAAAGMWASQPGRAAFYAVELAAGLAATDLQGATAFALGLPRLPHVLGPVMERLSTRAAQTGGAAGMVSWFNQLPDESARSAAFEHVVWRQLKEDPQAVKALIDAHPATHWNAPKIMNNVVEELADKDPMDAMLWAARQPPSPDDGRFRGVEKGMEIWMQRDAAAASAWLAQQQDQPWYDTAVPVLVETLVNTGQTGSQEWIATIKDEALRQDLTNKMMVIPSAGGQNNIEN